MKDQNGNETRLVPGVGRLPYPAYRGNEPYVFVSYAHDDWKRVFPEIKRFNEAGFHVWYDEGIAPGQEWSDEIARALSNAAVFVVMLTPVSAPRENVLNEIDFALNESKPFLAIQLEKTELTPGMKLRTARKQAILKYNMSEEEYEFKYIEAFTGFGLVRSNTAAVPAQVADAAETAALPSPASAPSPVSSVSAGMHAFGDYVPKGTAVITDGLGNEYRAIGNSLVYKPVGSTRIQSLLDVISAEKTPNGYVVKDSLGKETLLKTAPGDELWFMGETENHGVAKYEPEKIQINMVKSICVDPDRTPERKIGYCEIRMKDGSFKSPVDFLFFSVNENDGAPPDMKLKKDLNKYAIKKYASLWHLKKLTVMNIGEGAGPYNVRRSLFFEAQYAGTDTDIIRIADYFAIYAMGANGEIRQLDLEKLREIEIL